MKCVDITKHEKSGEITTLIVETKLHTFNSRNNIRFFAKCIELIKHIKNLQL